MGKQIGFIFKYFLYWMIYFIILKLVFLIYNYKISFQYLNKWTDVIIHGLRLDLSATGYIMLFPLFILLASIWIKGRWTYFSIRIYSIFFITVFSLLAATDLALYSEWGFRLDITPWLYLAKPKEALASVSILYVVLHLAIAGIIIFAFISFFKFLGKIFFAIDGLINRLFLSGITILLIGFMVLPIRGGVGKAPINTGSTYFSEVSFLNHATLNLPWNVGFSILNDVVDKNPFNYMKEDAARNLLDSFTYSSPRFQNILTLRKPNVILFILESFTANVTGCLNGPIQVTPELDKIARKGILFSRFYASGDRTDKGLLAVLSGFPSQPTTSLIKYVNKTEKLPSIPKSLKNYGYNSLFYYGGDAEFANYKSYLINSGFNSIVELKDFPKSQRICNWGVPDGFLFQRALTDLKKIKNPYFMTLLTLSSHTPFDIPMKPHMQGTSEEIKFFNSVYYTDHCIGAFIDSLENAGLLNNTLVIFIADHGFHLPGNLSQNNTLKYHIPMIWYGGAVVRHDTIVSTISNQIDIPSTVLAQLNIPSDEFIYGKNIFSENAPQHTVFEIDKGFGYVSDSLVYFFYNTPGQFSVVKGTITDRDKTMGKAFYQVLYDDIIHR